MGSQSLIEDKEVFYFMNTEIFKDIPNFEGMYQVSNFGNVKSIKFNKEKILKHSSNNRCYFDVNLHKNGKRKYFKIHQLVAMVFLNHTPCRNNLVVDHINDIKTDNRLENLQIITHRDNICKTQGQYSSKYKGVCWNKKTNKWHSQIMINNKIIHLGYFTDEYQAHLAYQNALQNI